VKTLQKFEHERDSDKANNLGNARLKAVNKAATQEAVRTVEKERRHAKDFDRYRWSVRLIFRGACAHRAFQSPEKQYRWLQ
jgi:hypothetical protein